MKQGAVSQPAAASTSRLPCIWESVPAAQARTRASSSRKTPPFLKRSISARPGAKVLLSKMNWARAAFMGRSGKGWWLASLILTKEVAGAPGVKKVFSGSGRGGTGQRPDFPAAQGPGFCGAPSVRCRPNISNAVKAGPTGERSPGALAKQACRKRGRGHQSCVGAGDEGTAMGGDMGSSVARSLPESDAGDCPALPSKRPFPRRSGAVAETAPSARSSTGPGNPEPRHPRKPLPTTKGDKPC